MNISRKQRAEIDWGPARLRSTYTNKCMNTHGCMLDLHECQEPRAAEGPERDGCLHTHNLEALC